MKKTLIYCIICLILIAGIAGCSSNNESASQNKEEPTQNNEKQEISDENETNNNEEQENQESVVLLDQDNIYIEYRGIIDDSTGGLMLDIYIENNRSSDIGINFDDSLINQYQVELPNSITTVKANSKYLSKANYDFLIDLNGLKAYGAKSIDTINFELDVYEASSYDEITKKQIELTPNKSIN